MEQPLILGHRGASAEAPENTLLAFRRAVEQGADGIECDVQRSADGHLVLIHDDTVDRTTGGAGRVRDLPLAALAALDAGEGEQIPTLEALLASAPAARTARGDAPFLDLELKQPGVGPDTLAALAAAPSRPPRDRLALSSFDYPSLEEVRRLDGEIELWLLGGATSAPLDELIARARAIEARCLALLHSLITAATVARAAEAGLGLVAWTVNRPADLRRLLDVTPPLRAIISDHPGLTSDERRATSDEQAGRNAG